MCRRSLFSHCCRRQNIRIIVSRTMLKHIPRSTAVTGSENERRNHAGLPALLFVDRLPDCVQDKQVVAWRRDTSEKVYLR